MMIWLDICQTPNRAGGGTNDASIREYEDYDGYDYFEYDVDDLNEEQLALVYS